MSWKRLSAENRVAPHRTSPEELAGLRAAARRNLLDASRTVISADNRFGLAYEAALLLAKMVLATAGWRVKGSGAHSTTFAGLRLAIGREADDFALYFDHCRRKRNALSYEVAGVASDADVEDLLERCRAFEKLAEAWIRANPPAPNR